MPWKESSVVGIRLEFVSRILEGERMSELCREYGISRKTGYKFLERYRSGGQQGLINQSRVPLRIARKTTNEIEKLIVDLRLKRPTWGAQKLRWFLIRKNPGLKFPVPSTITEILHRNNLIQQRVRRDYTYQATGLENATSPNDVWATDFKGQFRLGNNRYCYPLTVSDLASRYFIACESLENTKTTAVMDCFERIFSDYGMPRIIRSDNGSPFASSGFMNLSQLSIWWIKLGITPQRITPGHPEQNGSHERKHLTLKQETTRPPGKNHLQQQERFDEFLRIFNEERPHEALNMKTPDEVYKKSKIKYPTYQALEYPDCDETRCVYKDGKIRFTPKKTCFISRVFAGEEVGLRQITECLWLVKFSHLNLGYIDTKEMIFTEGDCLETIYPGTYKKNL